MAGQSDRDRVIERLACEWLGAEVERLNRDAQVLGFVVRIEAIKPGPVPVLSDVVRRNIAKVGQLMANLPDDRAERRAAVQAFVKRRLKRKPMSAAQRKAVGDRMRAYWRRKREGKS